MGIPANDTTTAAALLVLIVSLVVSITALARGFKPQATN